MATSKSAREKRAEELDAHFKARREQGLPAHRPQEHRASVEGVTVQTLAGTTYLTVSSSGGVSAEAALDQTTLGNLIQTLEAAFQAVS